MGARAKHSPEQYTFRHGLLAGAEQPSNTPDIVTKHYPEHQSAGANDPEHQSAGANHPEHQSAGTNDTQYKCSRK
jgi:hypothetical protein